MCRYLRDEPSEHGLLRLSSYLRAWGWAYLIFTLLLLLKRERRLKPSGTGPRFRTCCSITPY